MLFPKRANVLICVQAVVCLGFVLPLYVAFIVEAYLKLRFARQLGLVPRSIAFNDAAARGMLDGFISGSVHRNAVTWTFSGLNILAMSLMAVICCIVLTQPLGRELSSG